MLRTIILVILLISSGVGSAQDLHESLERCRDLLEQHRYSEIVDLLKPFDDLADVESRYAVAAEIGRAHFHLGDYDAANTALREAVRLRPQRVETALYLQASSYLVGDREQAYAIFSEIIRSGATDLWLAVSLPGERRFLADPRIWSILDELSTPLDTDIDRGAVLGVEMGQPRAVVEQRLGAGPTDRGSALTARAGSLLTWVFGFDDGETLSQIMLHNEHLYRYTPYRLQLTGELDWRTTPAAATRVLGAPGSTTATEDGLVIMAWDRGATRCTLEFAPPRSPAPPGFDPDEPALRVVRIEATETSGDW